MGNNGDRSGDTAAEHRGVESSLQRHRTALGSWGANLVPKGHRPLCHQRPVPSHPYGDQTNPRRAAFPQRWRPAGLGMHSVHPGLADTVGLCRGPRQPQRLHNRQTSHQTLHRGTRAERGGGGCGWPGGRGIRRTQGWARDRDGGGERVVQPKTRPGIGCLSGEGLGEAGEGLGATGTAATGTPSRGAARGAGWPFPLGSCSPGGSTPAPPAHAPTTQPRPG